MYHRHVCLFIVIVSKNKRLRRSLEFTTNAKIMKERKICGNYKFEDITDGPFGRQSDQSLRWVELKTGRTEVANEQTIVSL
jgi:hypothetical protein